MRYLIKADRLAQINIGKNRVAKDRLGEVRLAEVGPRRGRSRDDDECASTPPKPYIPVINSA